MLSIKKSFLGAYRCLLIKIIQIKEVSVCHHAHFDVLNLGLQIRSLI